MQEWKIIANADAGGPLWSTVVKLKIEENKHGAMQYRHKFE